MFDLPRGHGPADGVPLTTAAWERPIVVERLHYVGNGDLLVGAIPFGEMWGPLQQFRRAIADTLEGIDGSPLTALERGAAATALERLWHSAVRAEVMPLGFKDDRHLVTIAGARSGKGRSAIVPNLCIYPGSVFVLDPKGENATLTAERRGSGAPWCEGMGQEVYVLDPFGTANVPPHVRATFNPLSLLDPTSPTVVEDAALIAEGLVVPAGPESVHWDESARQVIQGFMLYAVHTYGRGATLFNLRRLLVEGDLQGWREACEEDPDQAHESTGLTVLLDKMRSVSSSNTSLTQAIIGTAETLAQCGESERGSILSTARRNTAFLDSGDPLFRSTLGTPSADQLRSFHPRELKVSPLGVSVYLCLPAGRMTAHGRWLRVILNLTLEQMQKSLDPPRVGFPALFVLDEFFTLGRMPSVEAAAGLAAGFGVKLWPILQDLQQLKSLYPTSWQTFLANAGAIQVFGASDRETCEYVSKMLGEIATRQTTTTRSRSEQEGYATRSQADQLAPIMNAVANKKVGTAVMQTTLALTADDRAKNKGISNQYNEQTQITLAPLLRPEEVARFFSAESNAGLLMIKGRLPIWTVRVNYDTSPWFVGRFTPRGVDRANPPTAPLKALGKLGARNVGAFMKCVDEFKALSSTLTPRA
jgi:type IV secretion system protein VirD4